MAIQLKEFSGFQNWTRPQVENRATFLPVIDEYIEEVSAPIRNLELKRLLINTYTNTLDTTLYHYVESDHLKTFVITGDIPAMWLRDSTAQVWQYFPLISSSQELKNIFSGLIRKQAELIALDPYANAFYHRPKFGVHKFDLTPMKPGVHERKWELDSLAYHVLLSAQYFNLTQDLDCFDEDWKMSYSLILETLRTQQRKHGHGPYVFDRITTNRVDTLSNRGYGPRYFPTGMIASAFRASDDACVYPFNIPGNFLALKVLTDIQPLLSNLQWTVRLEDTKSLAEEIKNGLKDWSIHTDSEYGHYLRFEVDGLGNALTIDEPNAPNLSSLAYLGILQLEDPVFVTTHSLMNSEQNPWYFSGKVAQGIGSPHTGKDMIWPMAMILNMFNQTSEIEIEKSLSQLIKSSAATGLLHESFHKDNANIYTRPWFAWCNSLFADVVIKLMTRHPGLIENY